MHEEMFLGKNVPYTQRNVLLIQQNFVTPTKKFVWLSDHKIVLLQ